MQEEIHQLIEDLKENENLIRLILLDIKNNKRFSLPKDIDKIPFEEIIKKYVEDTDGFYIAEFIKGPYQDKTDPEFKLEEDEFLIDLRSSGAMLSMRGKEFIYQVEGSKVKFKRIGHILIS